LNVEHHYDLSSRLYDLFLDRDRQYSCAYFRSHDDTLKVAQVNKVRHIMAKLLLKRPGLKVLDIGSGWGGLALQIASYADADVTGITLSMEQLTMSRARAKQAGLSARAHFELRDYRHETGRYDRIVSVEASGWFEGPCSLDLRALGMLKVLFREMERRITRSLSSGRALRGPIG